MPGEQWILGFIWPKKSHGFSISAQSYDFCPRLIQRDILDFTLSLMRSELLRCNVLFANFAVCLTVKLLGDTLCVLPLLCVLSSCDAL